MEVLLWSIVYFSDQENQTARAGPVYWIDALLGLLALILLPWRRRFPLPVALALVSLTCVSAAAVPAAGIALISLATHRQVKPVVLASLGWIAAGVVFEVIRPSEDAPGNGLLTQGITTAFTLGFAVATGFYIGARRSLLESFRVRAETAEREQASRVKQGQAMERERIAREMHDVLAHRISRIAMHSGALSYRTDLSQEETAQAAAVIRDDARLALADLRAVLGVLRSYDGTAAAQARPQPTLAAIEELIAQERQAGADITARVEVAPSEVPTTLSLTAFRIVQEALTNARKHAPGQPVDLTVDGAPGGRLSVVVRNQVPASVPDQPHEPLPSSGLGLVGLTERAVLAGGELAFGIDRAGDFVVRARLPWPS